MMTTTFYFNFSSGHHPNSVVFRCPDCGNDDIIYLHMPDRCYQCGHSYDFSITSLSSSVMERAKYFFRGERKINVKSKKES